MFDVKKAREEINAKYAEAEKLIASYADRDPTADEKAKKEELFAEMKRMQSQIEDAETLAAYSFANKPQLVTKAEKSPEQKAVEAFESRKAEPANYSAEDFGRAATYFAAHGVLPNEYATITTTTGSGIYLPKNVEIPSLATQGNAIREAFAAVGAQIPRLPYTAAVSVPFPTLSAGSDVTENATSATANSNDWSVNITLTPYANQSGTQWISNLTLQAVGYDLVQELGPAMVESQEQRAEAKVVSAIVADSGISSITLGGATNAALTDAALAQLDGILPKKFDRQKVIFLGDEAYRTALGLRASTGVPILQRDPNNPQLVRYNGTPVVRCSNLDNFGSAKTVGFIVSLVGFKYRDHATPQLVRYIADPAHPDQTGMNFVDYHSHGYVTAALYKLVTP